MLIVLAPVVVTFAMMDSPSRNVSGHWGSCEAALPDNFWRKPEHDGLNCIYIMMRMRGYAISYVDAWRAVRPDRCPTSLINLRDATRQLGLWTMLYTASPRDLRDCRLPAVVHLEAPHLNTRNFALLLRYGESIVDMIIGATATLDTMPTEIFRRRWSGFILVPNTSPSIRWGVAICSGVLSLFLYWLIRARLRAYCRKRTIYRPRRLADRPM